MVNTDRLSRRDRFTATAYRRLLDLALIVVGYLAYAKVRGIHGRDESPEAYARAVDHGRDVLAVQRWLRIPDEVDVQRPLLAHRTFMTWVGGYYGSAHFILTFGVLLWLMLRRGGMYAWWRNVLATTTALAVAGFALYPTAPPRLLPRDDPARTVDTLDTIGGLWSYNRGVLERISDPFAAMPSLHLGWATWVALALYFAGRRGRWRAAACAAYPLFTAFAVVATGTHWYLDAVAGSLLTGVVVMAGWLCFGPPRRPGAAVDEPAEAAPDLAVAGSTGR